ncbi:MAG: hypothetical protein ACQEW9_00260 [Bacteroidota bacterium]
MNDMQPDLEIKDNILLSNEVDQNNIAARRGPEPMISVCKFDEEIGDWVVITVNGNALPAMEAQGAVQLIDEDGDGYVTMENSCGIPVDCDDTDPDVTDDCDTCSDIEGLVRVTLPDGSCIYVHPTPNSVRIEWGGYPLDIPGLDNLTSREAALADFNGAANTQAIVDFLGDNSGVPYAAKLCTDLVAFGYDDWYLPAAGELEAITDQVGKTIVPFAGDSDDIWSSSEYGEFAWRIAFDGFTGFTVKNYSTYCLCVRK